MLLAFLLSTAALASPFDSASAIERLWYDEDVYFQPMDKTAVLNWTGVLYHYPSKTCFDLHQVNQSVTSREVKCDAAFLAKALEPYANIADFSVYRAKLLACLKSDDRKCLRGLIAKTMQVSFGVDAYVDRRDYLFEKRDLYARLRPLVEQGSVGEGDSRTFPPVVAEEGVGYRGEFKREKGRWLLRSFLAGD